MLKKKQKQKTKPKKKTKAKKKKNKTATVKNLRVLEFLLINFRLLYFYVLKIFKNNNFFT